MCKPTYRSRPLAAALPFALLLLWPLSHLGYARAAEAKAAPGRCFMWEAKSDTNTVYLLGSVHVATPDMYPLPGEVEDAFERSEKMAVEVNINKVDPAAIQQWMLRNGMYPGAETVADHVDEQTLEALRAYFARKGLPAAALEKFRPWALNVTIAMLEVQALGFRPELGVDKHFLDRAGDKPVLELETAEGQLKMLAGLDETLQAKYLAQTLESLDELKEDLQKLVDAWKRGDAESMETLVFEETLAEHPELKPVFEAMFDERNVGMTEKIEGYLKEDGPHFVIAGAGHLVGEKGLVKLLEAKGYEVKQVTTTNRPAPDPAPAVQVKPGPKPERRAPAAK